MDGVGSPSRVSFGGLATGLDTSALIEALLQVERQPLLRTQRDRGDVEKQQELFQTLSTMFLRLRDASRAIDNLTDSLVAASVSEEFLAYTAVSADEDVVRVEAGDTAAPGTFEIEVTALAATARRVSTTFAAPDQAISATPGTLTVAFGGEADINVAVDATTTLNDIASAINADEANGGAVRADVLFDGVEYRIIVSGTQAGAANDVTVTSDFGTFLDPDVSLQQDATDAQVTVLGVPITRPGNQFSDAIPGVTIDLLKASPGTPIQINVSRNDEAIEERLQEFVDAFNAIRDFGTEQSRFNAETKRAGPLSGNVSVRTLTGIVDRVLTTRLEFGTNPLHFASDIGIRFDPQGRLSLDSEQLREALDEDPLAVRQLLSGELGEGGQKGIASQLAAALEPVVRPGDGVFALQADGFERQLRTFDRRIEAFEARLETREETLVRQFAALESLISSLQAQSGFLASLQRE